MYILGGFDGFSCLNSIEKVDLSNNQVNFVELPKEKSLLCSLKNSANVLYKDKVYLIGGWDERDTLN